MDISIKNAHQDDYESLLPLFRQIHDLHVVFERPDLYKKLNSSRERILLMPAD